MVRDEVKKLLPVIEAFAEGRPVQVRDRRWTEDWSTINQDTTEFRFGLLMDGTLEWRVKPD